MLSFCMCRNNTEETTTGATKQNLQKQNFLRNLKKDTFYPISIFWPETNNLVAHNDLC